MKNGNKKLLRIGFLLLALIQVLVLSFGCSSPKEAEKPKLTANQEKMVELIYSKRSTWESGCSMIKLIRSNGSVILLCCPELNGAFSAGVMKPYTVIVDTDTLRPSTGTEYRTSDNLGLVSGFVNFNRRGTAEEKRAAIEQAVRNLG